MKFCVVIDHSHDNSLVLLSHKVVLFVFQHFTNWNLEILLNFDLMVNGFHKN